MSLTKVLTHTLLFIIITALVYILYYNVVMEIVFGSVYDGLNPVWIFLHCTLWNLSLTEKCHA